MNCYSNVFISLSPAVIPKAVDLFADIEVSGERDEFTVVSAAYRQIDDPALRLELEQLFEAEIRSPGAVCPL